MDLEVPLGAVFKAALVQEISNRVPLSFINFGLGRQYLFLKFTFKAFMGNVKVIRIHYLSDGVPEAAGSMDKTVKGESCNIKGFFARPF